MIIEKKMALFGCVKCHMKDCRSKCCLEKIEGQIKGKGRENDG